MASSWVDSWGSSWASSWGTIDSDGTSTADELARINLLSPQDRFDDPTLTSRLYDMVERSLNGQTRNSSSLTLDSGETTTTVYDPLFESHQIVLLQPMTLSAAAAQLTTYVSSRSQGSFVVTHASASGNEVFGYVFVG